MLFVLLCLMLCLALYIVSHVVLCVEWCSMLCLVPSVVLCFLVVSSGWFFLPLHNYWRLPCARRPSYSDATIQNNNNNKQRSEQKTHLHKQQQQQHTKRSNKSSHKTQRGASTIDSQ